MEMAQVKHVKDERSPKILLHESGELSRGSFAGARGPPGLIFLVELGCLALHGKTRLLYSVDCTIPEAILRTNL